MPDSPWVAPERLVRLPTWLLAHVATRSGQLVLDAIGTPERRALYAVLAAVAEFGPLSQAELSRRTGIDTADVVGLLRRGEALGLVGREVDPVDRRRNLVRLQPSGRDELRRLDRVLQRAQDRLLEPLDPAQRSAFVEHLQRLLDHHSDLGSRTL